MTKTIDWNAKEAYAKKLTLAQLEYAIKDCIEARDAMKGWNPEKEGYYQDEASIYSQELKRRRGGK